MKIIKNKLLVTKAIKKITAFQTQYSYLFIKTKNLK